MSLADGEDRLRAALGIERGPQGNLSPFPDTLTVALGRHRTTIPADDVLEVEALRAMWRRGATHGYVGTTSYGIAVQFGERPSFEGRMIPLGTRCWLLDVAREHLKDPDTNILAACEQGRYMEVHRRSPHAPWIAQGWWPELAETYELLRTAKDANAAGSGR